MSALTLEADMARHDRDVRFVSKADIGQSLLRSLPGGVPNLSPQL
jgi:hypothetical protein